MYTNAAFWRDMAIIGGSWIAGLAGYWWFKDDSIRHGSEREW